MSTVVEPRFDVPCRLQRPTRNGSKATILAHHPTNVWRRKERTITDSILPVSVRTLRNLFLHGQILFLAFASAFSAMSPTTLASLMHHQPFLISCDDFWIRVHDRSTARAQRATFNAAVTLLPTAKTFSSEDI